LPYWVSTRNAYRIVLEAASRGVDSGALCRSAGLDPEALKDLDGRVDGLSFVRLWEEAMARVGDPRFPFDVAESPGETQNVLRFLCMTCASLREALEMAGRYLRVVTNAVRWPIEARDDRVVVAIARGSLDSRTRADCRYVDEFTFAEIVFLGRQFTGVDWTPLEVRFAHDEVGDLAPYHERFRCPLRFSCARSEIDVPESVADLPLVRADASMRAFFETLAEKERGSDADPATTSATALVRAQLVRPHPGEAPSLEDVSAVLGMSSRTLRRRLQSENTTFQRVLDDARRTMAERHLLRGGISTAELAFVLGFSEESAFHRAFKRWTGTTPARFVESRASS
jgi:AraC-like DNA-binding protein